ncbi:hypothetical protein ARSEF1564_008979 [Beauveria bassiana]
MPAQMQLQKWKNFYRGELDDGVQHSRHA